MVGLVPYHRVIAVLCIDLFNLKLQTQSPSFVFFCSFDEALERIGYMFNELKSGTLSPLLCTSLKEKLFTDFFFCPLVRELLDKVVDCRVFYVVPEFTQ